MAHRHAWLLVAAVVIAALVVPTAAFALPPYSAPSAVPGYSTGFDDGELPLFASEPINVAEPSPAYWGRSVLDRRGGVSSLWCAGIDSLTGQPSTFTAYPPNTWGRTSADLTLLSDYYSATISVWYLMPSVGSDSDSFGIYIARLDGAGQAITPSDVRDSDIPVASAWTKRDYYLGSGAHASLSRQPVRFTATFRDGVESEPNGLTGRGPFLDDFSVSGYKFGPVRQLATTWSVEASGVALSWAPPQKSATSTVADTRPIVYRVWRSEAGTDTWSEITSKPTSECSLVDTSVASVALYDYVVQAWDPDLPDTYGVQSQKIRAVTPDAVTANGPDSTPPTTTVTAPTGWVLPPAAVTMTATDTGSGVDSIYYSTDGADPTTLYTEPLAISTQGQTTVKYRAMDRFGNMEDIHQRVVSVDGRAPETTAAVQAGIATGTVVLTPADDGVGFIAGTWYRLDGGAEQSGTIVPVVGGGSHQVVFRSADALGNTEAWQEFSFELPHNCSIEMTPSVTRVTYPNTVTLRGKLLDTNRSAVTSRTLYYEYSYDASSWARLATATPSGDSYVWTTRPIRLTYYRLVYPESSADSLYPPASGSAKPVQVLVSMSTPSASVSTTYRYRTFKVSALIRPKHTSGIKFRFFHLEGSKWVLRKTVYPKYSTYNSTTTKVYCSTSLSLRGKWIVKAYHYADTHPAQYSPYRSLTLR